MRITMKNDYAADMATIFKEGAEYPIPPSLASLAERMGFLFSCPNHGYHTTPGTDLSDVLRMVEKLDHRIERGKVKFA